MTGQLFVISTPIGNLKDISQRALDCLASCDLILAEDTRVSLKLLNYFNLSKKLVSCNNFNEKEKISYLQKILTDNWNIGLISDAGTPMISDPGYSIINAAIKLNIEPIIIPGPTALISALVKSGFSCEKFMFLGFLPDSAKQIREVFESLENINFPVIFYLPPHKIIWHLQQIALILGCQTKIALVKELTKIYEKCYRGNIENVIKELANDSLKGEFVLIINIEIDKNIKQQNDNNDINKFIEYSLANNISNKTILELLLISYPHISKSKLYRQILEIENNYKPA